jgi:tetratricopeptide (TPR) repeat protein
MRRALLAALLLAAAPALAQTAPAPSAEQRRADLDRLFEDLRRAPDEVAAQAIEARIRALWVQRLSPALALLFRRGVRNLEAGAAAEAVEDFDAVLTLDPEAVEALVLRAEALARAGEPRQAAEDLRRALALEPRHFAALAALSSLLEEAGDVTGAYRAMEAALALHPRLRGGEQRLRELRRRAFGEAT